VNPTLIGILLAGAPIAYDMLKSKRRRKPKRASKHKRSRRRNRR